MNSKRRLRVSNQCTNKYVLTSSGDVIPNSQSVHMHAVFLVQKCGGISKRCRMHLSVLFYDILIRDIPSRNILFVEFRIGVALEIENKNINSYFTMKIRCGLCDFGL